MTSRTVRRILISLALVPWVSAAPAVQQRSDLPPVKSLSVTCNFDLSQIGHDLCRPLILGNINLDTLSPPVGIVDAGEHSAMQRTTGEWVCRCEQILLPGNTKTRTDEAVDENIIVIESGARDVNMKEKQKDRHGDKDAARADEVNDDGPDDEDPIQEEENGQELIPPADRNFWSLTSILFVISFLLIIAARLFYVRWRRLVGSYRKPLRFRVSEAALLRWASEDMIFDDEELDIKAAGSGSLIMREDIPFNPSPRKDFVIQYGSAQ